LPENPGGKPRRKSYAKSGIMAIQPWEFDAIMSEFDIDAAYRKLMAKAESLEDLAAGLEWLLSRDDVEIGPDGRLVRTTTGG
jgi:hypothetical protein